jgi:hypothetical protein
MFLPTLRNDFGKVIYFQKDFDPGPGYLELGKRYQVENFSSEIQKFFPVVEKFQLKMTSNSAPAPFSCSTTLGAFSGSLFHALSGTGTYATQSNNGTITLDCGNEDKYFMHSFGMSFI